MRVQLRGTDYAGCVGRLNVAVPALRGELDGWAVADRSEQPSVVPPLDPTANDVTVSP
jgi:hypothetical protein